MKIVMTALVACMFATSSMAGGVSVSSAAHLPSEAAPMGGEIGNWIVPLLAIAIIALAVNSEPEKKPCAKSGAEGSQLNIIAVC